MNTSTEIKIGTEIVEAKGGFGFSGYLFDTIVRETKTQWVTSRGKKYRKDSLRVVGDGYGTLTVKTQEHVERNNKYNAESKVRMQMSKLGELRNKIPSNLSIEELEEIQKSLEYALEKLTPKKKEG